MTTPEADSRLMFRSPVEVRWGDMDAYKHVNNARYLTYLEQARLAWLDTLDKSWLGPNCAPVLAAAQINFRKSITWPASVDVILDCRKVGTSSITVGHQIVDRDTSDTLYCDGHTVLVWMDPATGKPVPLPAVIRKAVEGHNA